MSKFLTTLGEAINTKAVGGGGITGTEEEGNGLTDKVSGIINAVIAVLGILAVVVIILGGIQYMTSNGDAGKVKKAKDTILYGVIGLIIVILSAAIVNFVIFKVTAEPTA